MQVLIGLLIGAILYMQSLGDLAVLAVLGAIVGALADLLMRAAMRLPTAGLGQGGALALGILLRWTVIGGALVFGAQMVPLTPHLLVFVGCLVGSRIVAMALLALSPKLFSNAN